MRDDPVLLEPQRKVVETTIEYEGRALTFKIWDNVAEFVPEVLGSEDCYRLKELPGRMSVIDFGANVGTFTAGALLQQTTSGCVHVLAIEGDLDSIMLLRRNIRHNHLEHTTVRAVCAFVGDAGGQPLKRFYWKGPATLAAPLEVSTRLWDYLPSDRPRVIKMDIEESEIDLFKQPRFLAFAAMAQHFLMEFHAYDGYVYAEALGELGFQVELTGCGNPAPPYDASMARGMLYARK